MILEDLILFPQMMLPLYVFEPRYRDMLKESLEGSRMFCVARKRVDKESECPEQVAGIGLIRVALDHDNGTTHLVLQGLSRVILKAGAQFRTYPNYQIKVFQTYVENEEHVHALAERAKALAVSLLQGEAGEYGPDIPAITSSFASSNATHSQDASRAKLLEYLQYIKDPEQIGDLIASSLVNCPITKQQLLAISSLEERLDFLSKALIHENNLC